MTYDQSTIFVLTLVSIAIFLINRLNDRVVKNEQRLLSLLRHFGIDDLKYPTPSEQVLALLASPHKKKEAIHQYRTETGLGLKEAAEAIEEFSTESSGGSRG